MNKNKEGSIPIEEYFSPYPSINNHQSWICWEDRKVFQTVVHRSIEEYQTAVYYQSKVQHKTKS